MSMVGVYGIRGRVEKLPSDRSIIQKHRTSIDIYKRIVLEWITSVRYEDVVADPEKRVSNYLKVKPGFLHVEDYDGYIKQFQDTKYNKTRLIRISYDPHKTYLKDDGDDWNLRVEYKHGLCPLSDIVPSFDDVRVYALERYDYFDMVTYKEIKMKDYRRFSMALRDSSEYLKRIFDVTKGYRRLFPLQD